MTSAELIRLYAARAPKLMWFLGAGASATSGIPTAGDMIWDFKRALYCSEQKISVRVCQDLHDPDLQKKLQGFCDSQGRFPPAGSELEYAELFQAVHPSEADRRRYIDSMIQKGRPTFGHLALAAMMVQDRVRVVWTTNFDRNVEDAAVKLFQTTARLSVATLDTPQIAAESFHESRWPLLVKLHGDFSSRKLKNTAQELIAQDERLRSALRDASAGAGLIVAGYSGRDDSIMAVLEECVNTKGAFPAGLFWVVRPGAKPFTRVVTLLETARKFGVEAALVEANSFDELMQDMLLLERELPSEIAKLLESERPRVSDAPVPASRGAWPVIRFNALPITSFPTNCRKLTCKIGGSKEVRTAVHAAGSTVIAARRKAGVLAFGRDEDVRLTFGNFEPSAFDLHSIEPHRLDFQSVELGLLYDALTRALVRERGLLARRRQLTHFLAVPMSAAGSELFAPLRDAVRGPICGQFRDGGWWSDGIGIRLERRDSRFWLLFEPTTWIADIPEAGSWDDVREFQRKRAASRYNRHWNPLLDAWSSIITGAQNECSVAAFGIQDGVDAVFRIGSKTAYSRRWVR